MIFNSRGFRFPTGRRHFAIESIRQFTTKPTRFRKRYDLTRTQIIAIRLVRNVRGSRRLRLLLSKFFKSRPTDRRRLCSLTAWPWKSRTRNTLIRDVGRGALRTGELIIPRAPPTEGGYTLPMSVITGVNVSQPRHFWMATLSRRRDRSQIASVARRKPTRKSLWCNSSKLITPRYQKKRDQRCPKNRPGKWWRHPLHRYQLTPSKRNWQHILIMKVFKDGLHLTKRITLK